ncbi:MAG: MFS transporter [Vicinamibacterales bacterium]
MPPWLRALRHRNYRLFFVGQLISLTGTWMQSVALSWLVYRLSDSATLLGLVSFASQIPVFALALIGGATADRYNRHCILIATQSLSMVLAFCLASLTLLGVITIPQVFFFASLLGMVNAFDIPARQAFVVDMVGRQDLVNAIALNSSIFNGARVVGPAVAGLLVGLVGEGWCFFFNGVSFVAVIASLLAMRVTRHEAVLLPGSARARIREGFTYVGRTPPIRALLLQLGVLSLVGMPYVVLMPVFADDILQGGASGLGLLMGASGVGALAGALALATRKSVRGLGRWVARSSIGFGIALIAFSFSRSFWLSAAILVPMGFCMITAMAASNTLIQSMVPDHLRGRIMSLYSMMFMGMAPFGALWAGIAAGRWGAPATVALGGLACIVAAGIFGSRLSSLRVQTRELILAQQAAGGEPPQATTGQTSALVNVR